jgi:hypothetical protein
MDQKFQLFSHAARISLLHISLSKLLHLEEVVKKGFIPLTFVKNSHILYMVEQTFIEPESNDVHNNAHTLCGENFPL